MAPAGYGSLSGRDTSTHPQDQSRESRQLRRSGSTFVAAFVLLSVAVTCMIVLVCQFFKSFFPFRDKDLIQSLQEDPLRRKGVSVLFGWVKDSDSADTSSINAEEVEQLDDLLKAQDALKANIRVIHFC